MINIEEKSKKLQGFDLPEDILKKIEEKGNYIWAPKNCNGNNHVLGCSLVDLSEKGLLKQEDISTGFWIFEDSKILFTITEKGRDFIKR